MRIKLLWVLLPSLLLVSCWKFYNNRGVDPSYDRGPKVWGYKAVYGADTFARKITYTSAARNSVGQGNIYAYQKYLFQLDPGIGIHVIDNSVPASAHKIGFLTVRGCAQISIKDGKLYTNSYDDLVVVDFSNPSDVHEYSRVKNVFGEFLYDSPLASPPGPGYYECPEYGKLVTGWVKDSIYRTCSK